LSRDRELYNIVNRKIHYNNYKGVNPFIIPFLFLPSPSMEEPHIFLFLSLEGRREKDVELSLRGLLFSSFPRSFIGNPDAFALQ